jgi:protein-tyrosine phosphatase
MSAIASTRQARQQELNLRRTVLDCGPPTVQDFDQVIALLETAEKRINR